MRKNKAPIPQEAIHLYNTTLLSLQEIGRRTGCEYRRIERHLSKYYTETHMSMRASKANRASKAGDKNSQAILGSYVSTAGYLMVPRPEWYKGSGGGKVAKHKLVMCILEGVPKLPRGMGVHHIDENKLNNRYDNLQLMTNKEHMRLHCNQLK